MSAREREGEREARKREARGLLATKDKAKRDNARKRQGMKGDACLLCALPCITQRQGMKGEAKRPAYMYTQS